jgi:hypothetical protein
MVSTEQLIAQLDNLIGLFDSLKSKAIYADLSGLTDGAHQHFLTRCEAAAIRVGGAHSAYVKQLAEILSRPSHDGQKCIYAVGVIKALKDDVQAGYLRTFEELIHGDLFCDYLEMAHHLLEEGYKDAAAVLAGGTLEGHLRQLCIKHGIPTTTISGSIERPKKAEQMNTDLRSQSAYALLDQKNVTAWLDLRNRAAHGQYGSYTPDQVALLIDGVREFIARVPA